MSTAPPLRPEFIEGASPESIRHQIKLARAARDRWQVRVERLGQLLDTRLRQIDAGEWPPAPEEPTS
ncbi:hypothetical protein HY68_36525 [Streptomyces sp. AcH 505]|uniref:hypothetical protein n=1 Tax=Streptomyces sp. AcH 505 TaxID=352211 RepID=UPI000591BE00|nr:hypothetical protein HY68_36525 [Streptomyces sp. AcH 505]